MKRTTDKDPKDDGEIKRERRKKDPIKPRKKNSEDEDDDDGTWKTVTKGSVASTEKPKMFAKDADIDVKVYKSFIIKNLVIV